MSAKSIVVLGAVGLLGVALSGCAYYGEPYGYSYGYTDYYGYGPYYDYSYAPYPYYYGYGYGYRGRYYRHYPHHYYGHYTRYSRSYTPTRSYRGFTPSAGRFVGHAAVSYRGSSGHYNRTTGYR